MHQFYPCDLLLVLQSTCVGDSPTCALAPELFYGIFTCIMRFMGTFIFDSDLFLGVFSSWIPLHAIPNSN
jgi:hypothetical protein